MLNDMKLKLAVLAALAMLISSCGGTDKAATSTPSNATEPGVSSAPSTGAPVASTPVIESGRVSDAAIAALVDDSGHVDETLRTKVVDAILALPEDQQLAVLGDLSMRAEIEVAAASGLETAIGSPAAPKPRCAERGRRSVRRLRRSTQPRHSIRRRALLVCAGSRRHRPVRSVRSAS